MCKSLLKQNLSQLLKINTQNKCNEIIKMQNEGIKVKKKMSTLIQLMTNEKN